MLMFDPFLVPEDDRTPFAKIQEEIDRSEWIGRGQNRLLSGGGNTLTEHDSEVGADKNRR